ncbi:pyridoxamine 5'-phosphate oxidase family protein [Candidatus Gottesmanbacteria bacterium]|nr:pyridoxamine 5'-phosphate oxidase family protein [Candidatus Gottesmanbacteria bacterium]
MNKKQKLLQYLKSQKLMSLSTCGDKPWTSNVYYTIDDNFHLYFLSEPESRHCKDINANPNVSCSITDSSQKVTDKKVGTQIQGTAVQMTDIDQIKKALESWNRDIPGFAHIINWENMEKHIIKSKVYKITPTSIKFLNEALYGPEGTETFKF